MPGPVTADSAGELQGGEPAEHLRDREMELSGQLGGAPSEDVREVNQDAVTLPWQLETEALGGLQGVVQDLPSHPERRQDVASVLYQPGSVAYERMSAYGERREDAARHGHYLFM